MDADPIHGTREVGSRGATKVRVITGAYTGRRGIVVRVDHPGSIRVRFESGVTLPFGRCELQRREA